ncbi:MarR family transcriptional regulator [Neorhizobium sp. P12A]|uniref:MarR family winged helix-turn-helix transcriptional regulator n=1 Tax=Neorhizobium sp. P12A TaxID=2268027 RepID=UPI0011EE0D78|nr:MarR family winged helix-turn-helix transcriptional regulator [Neorhizobium sp. P12A]KAA0695607.1 MarR family transcriptional regulator [Neorhizobium sp. P12A]
MRFSHAIAATRSGSEWGHFDLKPQLTPSQMLVGILKKQPGPSLGEIADGTGLTGSDAAAIVGRLCDADIIVAGRVENRFNLSASEKARYERALKGEI